MDSLLINHWHWLILAVVLLVVEVSTGTAFFLWLSAASSAVAIVVYFIPDLIWEYQLALASIFIVLSIMLWRQWGKWFKQSHRVDNYSLNRRSEQYVGRIFNLSEAIVNGVGKIVVDDSTWRVSGDDAPIDTRVEVVAAQGMILKVNLLKKEFKE